MAWSIIQSLITLFLASIFRLFGADASRAPVAGLVAGRIYWNTNTGIAAVKPFLGWIKRIPDFTNALGGDQGTRYERELLPIVMSHLPDVGFSWSKYILSWPRILYDFLTHSPRRGDAWTLQLQADVNRITATDVESLSTPDLLAFLQKVIENQFKGWDLLYLVTQAAALPIFQRACQRWLNDPGLALGYRLFAGMGGVPEVEAGLALWRLAVLAQEDAETLAVVGSQKGWEDVQPLLTRTSHGREFLCAWSAFMMEHGHHCRGELELFNRRWSETPDYILKIVRGYLHATGDLSPLQKQERLTQERLALTAQCRERLRNPLKRWIFSASLRRAQRLAINREAWKNEAVREMAFLRRVLLLLGRRLSETGILSEPEDIFFLSYSELKVIGTSNPGLRERILARRHEYAYNLTLSPPPLVFGQYRPHQTGLRRPTPDATVLEGIAVSPGVVSGPARVILRTDDHEQVLQGEILVAPFTDPAWTPYFVTAAGVVMDQGGILSHGSIVAREFGLPAVTNAHAATRVIRTGDIVEVDGNRGRVTILQRGTN